MERWKINLYTVWFSQIISIMSFSFGFPFLPFYVQELGVVDPDKLKLYTGLLNTSAAITMAVMAPVWGLIADRWGKKLMLLRATFFASFIIAGMGLAMNVHQLIIMRLIQGIFTGTVTASAALVASGTPSNRLSYAMGFMSSSTFIGASIGPVIGGFVAEAAGYRTSFFIGGLLMMIDFFIVLFLVKEKKIEEQPGNAIEDREKSKQASLASIFTSLIIIMLFVLVILRMTRTVFAPYLPLFVQELLSGGGGAVKYTGIINGVTGLTTALSGLTISRLGDRCSKMTLILLLFIAGVVCSIPLAFSRNLWVFIVVYGLFFFIMGGIEPVVVSMTTEITPPERRGVLFGIQGLVGNIGWAISPMLGSLVSMRYSIQAILLVLPIIMLPGIGAVFLLRMKENKPSAANTDIQV